MFMCATLACADRTAVSPTPGESPSPTTELVVSTFDVTMRFAGGQFHYAPHVIVRAPAAGPVVVVRSMSFALGDAPVSAGSLFDVDQPIEPNGQLEIGTLRGEAEFSSPAIAVLAFLTLEYSRGRGTGRVLVATTVLDCVARGPCAGEDHRSVVSISEFKVTMSPAADGTLLRPTMTLRESGRWSAARVEHVTFTTNDYSGARDVYSPVVGPWELPAGGTIRLFEPGTGNTPTLLLGHSEGSFELSAEIVFVDDSGVGRTATGSVLFDLKPVGGASR